MDSGYKVLKINGDSFIADGRARVHYRSGKWVTAPKWLMKKGYHLTYFDDLVNAKYFISNNFTSNCEIWTCQVIDIIPPWQMPAKMSVDELQYGDLRVSVKAWPIGTRMARAIKIVDVL